MLEKFDIFMVPDVNDLEPTSEILDIFYFVEFFLSSRDIIK